MALTSEHREELSAIAARYPKPRSGLNPMLHYVQAVEGSVTAQAIEMCAEVVGLEPAEVAAVASFYTMYKRHQVGKHHIGVCVNPQCGILGGEAIFAALSEDLGVGHDETTADGAITIERIECQAACTHAPVATVDWEFMDNMTIEAMRDIVAKLRNGERVFSTRGPEIRSFRDAELAIAGIDDGLGDAGGNCVDDKLLRGLEVARERGMPSAFPDSGEGR